MHHPIDSLAYTNRLRYLPPVQKLGLAIAAIALSFVAPPAIQVAIALWLSVWIVVYAGIPLRIYGQLLALPLGFALASLPAMVLSGSWQPETLPADAVAGITLGNLYLYLSQQGLAQAIALLTRSLALVTAMYFVLLTVPFAELLHVLECWGCPAIVVELLALMYRFIFLLTAIASELIAAQKARSGFSSWRRRWRSVALVASQLMRRSLADYRQISLGLAARGYNGKLQFWRAHRYRWQPRYALEALVGCAVLVALTGWCYVA